MNTIEATKSAATLPQEVSQKPSPKPWLLWSRRLLLGLLVTVVILAVAGASYQAYASARDLRTFAPLGQMVDVGGYKLHIYCEGTGSPTVILESGQGGLSADWAWIQPQIAKSTRVCTYDRAGIAWSEPGPLPRDARQIATELKTLLEKADLPGPYLLVGHSYGGHYVRVFAATYPEAVQGMVLLDASHPDQWSRDPAGAAQFAQVKRFYQLADVLTRLGILRLINYTPITPSLPPTAAAVHKAFSDSTQYVATTAAEFNATEATNQQVREAGVLGALPLFVLTATDHGRPEIEAIGQELQLELTQLSTNSLQRVVEGATHSSIIIEEEDALTTVDAIQRVLAAVRSGEPLVER